MDDDPRNDTTKTAEIIELSEYLPDETPRNLGAEVVRIADFQQHPRADSEPEQTDDNSGELAAVYDFDTGLSEEDIIEQQLDEIISNIKSLPEQQYDVNAFLGQISESIGGIFEELDDRQKLRLSAQLAYSLSGCHENISRLVVNYPDLLKIVAIAANIGKDEHHPALQNTRMRAIGVLSTMPGEYDLETGTYTPPNQ